MKKLLNVFLVVLLCIEVLLLVSCSNGEETIEPALNHPIWGDVKLEDIKPLKKILTQKYDLDELTEFFGNRTCHVSIIHKEDLPLRFREVNERFPVEVVRPGDYTVYKVRQGGYFYVFWDHTAVNDSFGYIPIGESDNGIVYATAYLCKEKKAAAFESVIPGVSTAEDVRKIDPFLEMDFLRSTGTYSYSYLNKDMILEIKYKKAVNIDGYDDLIVEDIEIRPKASLVSRYAYILQQDLP